MCTWPRPGRLADRYAAGAIFGLSLFLSQYGIDRLGTCTIAACPRVFLDASTNRSRRYCAEHGAARGKCHDDAARPPGGRRRPRGHRRELTSARRRRNPGSCAAYFRPIYGGVPAAKSCSGGPSPALVAL